MKKILLLTCLLGFGMLGFSQKYAVIDTRYILDKMPDYKTAQKQLDDIAADWQKDIDAQQKELDNMYKEKINFLIKKRVCGIYSANALVLREICLKKGRN